MPPVTGGAVKPDGSFEWKSLAPDWFLVTPAGFGENVYLKSIRLATQEMPHRVLDLRAGTGGASATVVLSAAGAQISGTVQDSKGPVPGAAVVLFSDDPNRGAHALTGEDGTFAIHGLPPGTYWIAAALQSDKDHAERIELNEGDKLTRDLKLPRE
jgi:hypothetical protein